MSARITPTPPTPHTDWEAAAASLLDAARAQDWDSEEARQARRAFAEVSPTALAHALAPDSLRMAVYLNLYNAWAQVLASQHLKRNPHGRIPLGLFLRRRIPFANRRVSLNTLEHSLLRAGQLWWALGYLPEPLAAGWKKQLRMPLLEPRLHFALNCAAASCPPIRYYQADQLESQLQLATNSYLEQEVHWSPQQGLLELPGVFRFYPGDFGGKAGIRAFVRRHGYWPQAEVRRVRFRPWDWSARPNNFTN